MVALRGDARGGFGGGRAEPGGALRQTIEEARRGFGARVDVERAIDLGARRADPLLGGAPLVRHDEGEPRGHGFGDPEAEGLVGAAVEERVGAGHGGGELVAVALEAEEGHVVPPGHALLHALTLGAVAEHDERRLAALAKPQERVEDHVPALLHRKAPDGEQERPRAPGEELAPCGLAPRARREELLVDAEGEVDEARDVVGGELLELPPRGDERGRAAAGDGADPRPERLDEGVGAAGADLPLDAAAEVGVDEVGVPDEGPDPVGAPRDRQGAHRGDVGRVNLEHIRVRLDDRPPDFVDPPEQVVGRIVRERWPTYMSYGRRSGSCLQRKRVGAVQLRVGRARGDDDVVMAQLARNVTLLREMASNPASPYRVEFRDVDDLHGSPRAAAGAEVVALRPWTNAAKPQSFLASEELPFAALAARHGRPLRVAILSDFTRIPYANGAAFQTRFLYQELRRCGHEVTVIGPRDPDATPDELAPGTIELPSVPLKTYPGVHIPLPLEKWVYDASRWDFDIIFAQTTSLLVEFGIWLRRMKGIPLLCVNTTHLAAAYDVLLPESISKIEAVHAGLEIMFRRPYEELFAKIYNDSDGLVVLSEGLRRYWRERGVTAPIHVIPRAVQPDNFDRPLGADPYVRLLGEKGSKGARLLCAGRHTREKSQDRLIRIFAEHIAPHDPDVTLTLIGEGPDSAFYKRVAKDLGVEDRVIFPGEVPFSTMADYYAYADVFVHASVSETYGNVMGEALWCGTPTVAFADGMGVSSQIQDGVNGVLLAPGGRDGGGPEADLAFGRAVLALLEDPQRRARLGQMASKTARERAHPNMVQAKLADAFTHAQEHAAACGLRPAVARPLPFRWYTTFKYFRPWTTLMGGIYLFGHLRPAKGESRAKMHPQIGH